MKGKASFKQKTVKRLARLAKVPPARIIPSKKTKLANKKGFDWRRELAEPDPEPNDKGHNQGG